MVLTAWSSYCFFFEDPWFHASKESGSSLGVLDTLIYYCQQISHKFSLLHVDLLNSLDVSDLVTEGIDDFNVLDVQNSVLGIVETFYVNPKAFTMHLLDGL
jgi:hypothetical protein